ncbi:divalent metal cation transporter [Parvibaculum sedimenti]|uniref:Divalent metal cation transporter n=1 Tax=Parvibaculum sedimenti TaxID=2608632 RepID=A0A6N6VH70_9HYPH|nr:divalent metal cation transporter [Parvibaculum sedimenti]KAB7739057.1 divalent metal cation transporter [Parvibaculum sedimenti]
MTNPDDAANAPDDDAQPRFALLGPGLTTGASDDDPSGIATYSQAGAQFGYGLAWTLVLSLPLMAAIQEISARIGRVSGHGIAGNLARYYPRPVLYAIVGLLCIANTINIGADLGAMGAALQLLIGGPAPVYVVLFGAASVLAEVFIQYARYEPALKWLTLTLFAYVATLFAVDVPWSELPGDVFLPSISYNTAYFTSIVAVFGTTISPYLFFWQAEEEVESTDGDPRRPPLATDPKWAVREFSRIRLDTVVGMVFSNVVALAILMTTAATLHVHGVTDIETSAQAAEALRPIAGPFAFVLFAAGIIGTGLLAVPVLAGSAAYAVGEAMGWPSGLARKPGEAKAFYGVVAFSTLIGVAMNFLEINPIKALFWSAVINGFVAVPVMVMMMLMTKRPEIMGELMLPKGLRLLGWLSTLVMLATVVGLIVTL